MLILICALPCEAQALIEHYRLQRQTQHHAFPIYGGEQLTLIVSGIGTLNAAAATAYLGAMHHQNLSAWINIGIAGHPDANIGDCYFAHKITDANHGRSWYPQLVFKSALPSAALISLSTPSEQYRPATLYDMEAAGFYAIATRFSSAEMIHSLKIISDNQHTNTSTITTAKTQAWIHAALPQLCTHIAQLQEVLRSQHISKPSMQDYLQHWHFTQTQQHQLHQLLQRHQALLGHTPDIASLSTLNHARAVLQQLSAQLDNIARQQLFAS